MSKIREQNIGQILIDQYEPEDPVAKDQNHSRLHLKKNIKQLRLIIHFEF